MEKLSVAPKTVYAQMGRSSCGAVALKRVPIVNANATFVTIWAVQDTKKKSEIKEDVLSLFQSHFLGSHSAPQEFVGHFCHFVPTDPL